MNIQKENRNEIHTLIESDLREYRLTAEEIGYYKAIHSIHAYIAMMKYYAEKNDYTVSETLKNLQDFIQNLNVAKIIRGE